MPVAAPFNLKVEPLGPYHDRTGFTCGIESLNRYFRMQAGQDVKRKTNGVFVLIDPHQPNEVLGYYTLCASASVVGSSMLIIDAMSEQVAVFYEAHGFVRLPDSLRLILPMRAIGKLIE